MTKPDKVAIDASLLVALVDTRDKWHASAIALRDALKRRGALLVYFDIVLNEAISVLARRAREQGRSHEFQGLLDTVVSQVPTEVVTWLSTETRRLYDQVISLVCNTAGELNFHDALIALGCQKLGVGIIATFDADFDHVDWLVRADTPDAAMAALKEGETE